MDITAQEFYDNFHATSGQISITKSQHGFWLDTGGLLMVSANSMSGCQSGHVRWIEYEMLDEDEATEVFGVRPNVKVSGLPQPNGD